MVIHGPLTAPYDFDLGPIIIQDCKVLRTLYKIKVANLNRFPYSVRGAYS